ncbi:Ankyrin repeat and protein kinase domain-containing protein 1 [Penicillium hispanicum]|uniref:Ankyrin repeat and protein kinase domain-containing protein 1 n=1 Tax=Penicillium hispanicum TaxID=1080232 RepID=UPI00254135CF|nr:Ankyrin repeat and protein kinase domain-containing protein 1 [Penicillium hispanicum]KAJ5580043.1 Ankyrin repeat and protein kinase domain-containing protein 1 [Penicillium hispanicum]
MLLLNLPYELLLPKHVENTRQLLELGADLDIPDYLFWTPLYNSIEEENEASVEALLMHGADPNLKKETYSYQCLPTHSWYPLQRAQEKGNAKIAELLRIHRAVEQNDHESEDKVPGHEMVK